MAGRAAAAIFCLLACGVLLSSAQVSADEAAEPKQVLDPVTALSSTAAGAAAGATLAAATGGKLKPEITQGIVGNSIVAASSAGQALGNAGAAVGSLVAGKLGAIGSLGTAHASAGKALVDIVRALNSLHIAGTTAFAGAADAALSGVMGHIRSEAENLGNVYLQLVGEFGRSVGAGLNAIETLSKPLAFLNPVMLGVEAMEKCINTLIKFLQGLADISVASPNKAALLQPFIGTLQAVNLLLNGLQTLIAGPAGGLVNAVQGAADAAGNVLGDVAGGVPGVAGLAGGVQQALNLLGPLLGAVAGH